MYGEENSIKDGFRVPTTTEVDSVRQLIVKEEQELTELNSRISTHQKEVEDKEAAVAVMESVLGAARELAACSKQTTLSLRAIHGLSLPKFDPEDLRPANCSQSSDTSSTMIQDQTLPILSGLESTHAELLKAAEAAHREANLKVHDAEQDVSAGKSTLYFLRDSLSSLHYLKERTKDRLSRMKDLTSSRRRIPDELWAQIFEMRVGEDEEKLTSRDFSGPAPFTVVRLTWVCRLWRTIITRKPSLWRYIAIPSRQHISHNQWDRIRYFRQRLKNNSPHVYAVPKASSFDNSRYSFRDLLTQFDSFQRMKLYVPRDSFYIESAFEVSQPHVHELLLIGDYPGTHPAIGIPSLDMSFLLRNVHTLSCTRVRPYISVDSISNMPHLRSVHLDLPAISPHSMTSFLSAASTLNSVTLDHIDGRPEYVDPYLTVEQNLPNVTTLSTTLSILTHVFKANIRLPSLKTVYVRVWHHSSDERALERWDSFLSAGQRRNTINTLGFTLNPRWTTPPSTIEKVAQFIKRLPKCQRLKLTGVLVVPILERLAEDIPEELHHLIAAKSDEVTEEHFETFIKAFYSKRNRPLSLQIDECSSISEPGKMGLLDMIDTLGGETR
jgi:hypothetical protein